jgi:hypothetical protein
MLVPKKKPLQKRENKAKQLTLEQELMIERAINEIDWNVVQQVAKVMCTPIHDASSALKDLRYLARGEVRGDEEIPIGDIDEFIAEYVQVRCFPKRNINLHRNRVGNNIFRSCM